MFTSIEWIAYHFHVLNLRHLIITSDPTSQTSPNSVLNRWQDKMKIEIWSDTQTFEGMNVTRNKRVEASDSTRRLAKRKLTLHRLRQFTFNKKCLRHLKRQNKGWVILADTDEFISINPAHNASRDGEQYAIEQPGSVMAFLQNMSMPRPLIEFNTPCVPIMRRQYSAQESHTEDVNAHVPSKFNGLMFATLRWRNWITGNDIFRSPTGQECSFKRRAGPGKSIIDLARLRYIDLFHEDITGNPHRPLENICPFDQMYPKKSGLMIHHYLGTFEQWTYRTDSRGDSHRWGRYAVMRSPQKIQESDTVNRWLEGFIESVGDAEASRLLQSVGELEPLPKSDESNSTLPEFVPEAEAYKVGDLVQVYSKKYWRKGWHWGQIRDAGQYYNIVFLENCKELLGVTDKEMRKNGTVDGEGILSLLTNLTHNDKR